MPFINRYSSIKKIALIVSVVVSFFSCASGNDKQGNAGNVDSQTAAIPAPVFDASLPKGKVINSVICKSDSSQGYALYLPSNYNADKQFPCIFFYDAHARGAMPVKMYKDIAEKYGFVLIGSNNSKNGMQWEVTNEAVKKLMQDSRTRVNIDSKRMYTSGFSGGSRVASSIAIIDGGIAGVIGCAAGFPNVQAIEHKFDYFGMVGEQDFNLAEMSQLDNMLEQKGFTHQLLIFNGIHGWPPATDFETAIVWIQVNGMKEHLQPMNDTLVNWLKDDLSKRVATTRKENDLVQTKLLLDGAIRVLYGTTDVSSYKKQLTELVAGNSYKQAVSLHQQLLQEEASLQSELAKQFPAQTVQWWTDKIAELNKNIHSSKTPQASQMYQRVVNYLGLMGYLYSDHALKSGDLANTDNYLRIFKIADPKNPDCHYLAAIYHAKKGETAAAYDELMQAAQLGYCDLSELLSEPAFLDLRNNNSAGFEKVRNKVIENQGV